MWANELIQAIADRNVCIEFEEIRSKIELRPLEHRCIQAHIVLKPPRMCSRDQDRCVFMITGRHLTMVVVLIVQCSYENPLLVKLSVLNRKYIHVRRSFEEVYFLVGLNGLWCVDWQVLVGVYREQHLPDVCLPTKQNTRINKVLSGFICFICIVSDHPCNNRHQ